MFYYVSSKVQFLTVFSLLCLCLGSCTRTQVKGSGSLPSLASQELQPDIIEEHSLINIKNFVDVDDLSKLNQEAGVPTFGLIPAFYQLPQARPAGAVYIEEGIVFGAANRSFWLQDIASTPYVVLPASTEQSQVFEQAMNQFLDAGLRFSEVSLADAMRAIEAERRMIESHQVWFPRQQLPSGVDLLISIGRGQGLYGPAFVGRVLRSKDGRLLALATQIDAGPSSLEPLLVKLVMDTLRRLAHENRTRT